jgi:hypothetical protein
VKAVLTMAHDVMISHSHADKPAADAACAALEAKGIRCWIAPRDINPGQDWAASIVEAIRGARIMLLVFSRHANQSAQVQREVAQAANSGKVLLPLRIEDVLPEAALEYYLGTPHWLDAITPPFDAHLEKLADACSSLVAVTGRSPQDADQGSATSNPAPVVTTLSTEQPTAHHGPPMMLWWRRQRRQVRVGLIAATVVILAAAGVTFQLLRPHSPPSPSPIARPSTTAPTTTTPAPAPPVAEAALDGLLLSPDQINSAMGTTGMAVTDNGTVMDDASAHDPDKACQAVDGPLMAPVYAGSGWTAFREQVLNEAGGNPPRFDQGVVLFSSARDAAAFFTASAQLWPSCSNRQYTSTNASNQVEVWNVAPISNAAGVLSVAQTLQGEPTWKWQFCKHALTVANNVVIDVSACTHTPSDYQSDSAINVARQIAAKVPTT